MVVVAVAKAITRLSLRTTASWSLPTNFLITSIKKTRKQRRFAVNLLSGVACCNSFVLLRTTTINRSTDQPIKRSIYSLALDLTTGSARSSNVWFLKWENLLCQLCLFLHTMVQRRFTMWWVLMIDTMSYSLFFLLPTPHLCSFFSFLSGCDV